MEQTNIDYVHTNLPLQEREKERLTFPAQANISREGFSFADLTPFKSIQCYILHTDMDFHEQK